MSLGGVGQGRLELVEAGPELVEEVGGGVVGGYGLLALERQLLLFLRTLSLALVNHELCPQTWPKTEKKCRHLYF